MRHAHVEGSGLASDPEHPAAHLEVLEKRPDRSLVDDVPTVEDDDPIGQGEDEIEVS